MIKVYEAGRDTYRWTCVINALAIAYVLT